MSKLAKILFILAGISVLCFAVIRFLAGGWVPFLWIALAMMFAALIGGIYVDRKLFFEFLNLKTTKQGMSMGGMTGLVLVFLVAINVLGARRYLIWDFSLGKVNTLSDQSIQLLKSLKSDLKVIYFYKEGSEGVDQNKRSFTELIRKYEDQSEQVKLEFVEINKRPDLTEKYKVTKGTQAVLLEYQGKTNLIEKIDEQEITGALVKVTREKSKKIFILSGHHEMSLEPSQDGHSVSLLKTMLEGNNYTVETLSLTNVPQVPSDADVVMVLGPEQGFIDSEVKVIDAYLKTGGSLILALKPGTSHKLDLFLKQFGIELQNNFIATALETPMGKMVDPRFARGSEFSKKNQITSPFGQSEFTVFRLPQSLKVSKAPEGISIDEIVKTNTSAVAYKSLDFQNGASAPGPFTLAVDVNGVFSGEQNKKPFRLLVFGDANFVGDQYLYQNLNRDLVLNSIAALAKEENLIAVTPKEVGATKLEMQDGQFYLFIFAFILPLPFLFFIASGVVWFRRRYA